MVEQALNKFLGVGTPKPKPAPFTQEDMYKMFDYFPETGELLNTYEIAWNVHTCGGRYNPRVLIDGKYYPAGKVIWLYMTGE